MASQELESRDVPILQMGSPYILENRCHSGVFVIPILRDYSLRDLCIELRDFITFHGQACSHCYLAKCHSRVDCVPLIHLFIFLSPRVNPSYYVVSFHNFSVKILITFGKFL